jgi:hypothetical protein
MRLNGGKTLPAGIISVVKELSSSAAEFGKRPIGKATGISLLRLNILVKPAEKSGKTWQHDSDIVT